MLGWVFLLCGGKPANCKFAARCMLRAARVAVFLAARRHGGFRLRRFFCATSARSLKSQWPRRARSRPLPQNTPMSARGRLR